VVAVVISHERRVLFVHVHRTGGTSIQKHLKETLFGAQNLGLQHSSLIEAKRLIGPEFASYFKFAFVRSPWERLISWFFLMRRHYLDDAPPPELSGPESLPDYLKRCLQIIEGGQRWHYQCPPQQITLLEDDDGSVGVDALGRFESFQQDLETICRRLAITSAIPHLNPTTHQNYRSYYTPESRRRVQFIYERDIQTFGYEF
jgi:chondroitin 4-sulfotransferase 11